MKAKRPTAGRPTIRPTAMQLARMGSFSGMITDIKRILFQWRKQNPEIRDKIDMMFSPNRRVTRDEKGNSWIDFKKQDFTPKPVSDEELATIFAVFQCPSLLSSKCAEIRKESNELALKWSRLWAEHPRMMIEALPKIDKRLCKMHRSPQQAVVSHFLLKNDFSRLGFSADNFCDRFFSEDASIMSAELAARLRLPISVKIVEHARREIRKLFPQNMK